MRLKIAEKSGRPFLLSFFCTFGVHQTSAREDGSSVSSVPVIPSVISKSTNLMTKDPGVEVFFICYFAPGINELLDMT